MSDDFNPYHKWLGIPAKDQPADHYRLLGVARFESDRDVITGASDQRINFLHTLQSGEHGKRVDKLLNEIANAKACLLNQEKKAAYDKSLRAKTAPAEESAEKSRGKPLFEADAAPASQRRSKRSAKDSSTRSDKRPAKRAGTRARKKDAAETKSPRRLVPIMAIGLGVLTVIIVVLIMMLVGNDAQDDVARSDRQQSNPPARTEKPSPAPKNENDPLANATQKLEEPSVNRQAQEPEKTAAAKKQAEQKAKEAEQAARAKAEAERKAKEQSERKAKQESDRKAKEQEVLKNKRAEAKQRQAARQQAQQTLAISNLVQVDNTWRLLDLEKKLLELAPVAPNNTPSTTPIGVRNFMKSYGDAMLEEFQRRTAARTQQGKPVVHSEWMIFMARNHPEIDATQFGLTRNRIQKFYDRAKQEARIFDKIRLSPQAKVADPSPGAAQPLREEIRKTYELLDENTEVKTALQILGHRLGDPPIDATKLQTGNPNASSLAVNPFKSTRKNPRVSKTIPPARPNQKLRAKDHKKNRQSKAQVEAIALLKKKGLAEGKDGWSPKEMTDLLNTLEEDVANLQTEGLTPEQEKEVSSGIKEYYQKKFNDWLKLDEIGQERARARGFPPGSVTLSPPERLMHMYLRDHLLAPKRRGVAPKIMPDVVMEEEARTAALQALAKKYPGYLTRAKQQHKKKSKQIKTMEKKIRMRIKSLQKEPGVQDALETLGSEFDSRFVPQ